MTVYAFKAECLAGEKATLGFRGESGRTQVIIDATAWIEEFGEGGLLRLRHEPDEGEAYSPASQTVENGVLTWTIAASDTASVGSGRAEVWYTVNGVAVASAVFRTNVLWSITEPGTEIPTGIDDWLARADEALATITGKADQSDLDAEIARATEAEGGLQDQIDEIIAGGGGGGGGAVLSVNGQTGHVVLTAADVDALPDSTRIPAKTSDLVNDSGYITNAGVTSFNGQTGAVSYSAPVSSVNGQTGAVTGLATSAEVTTAVSGKADKATTLAGYGIDNAYTKNQTDAALAGKQDKLTAGANITIVNNVISAAGGQGGGAVDSVNGKTGVVVLDAADVGALSDDTAIPTKVSDLINDEGFGTYSLPSGGIPLTDLALSVQTSLGKADTALQTAPVSSVDGKTGAVVILPEGGTQGQVLKKNSNNDYDVKWANDESGSGGTSDYSDLTNKPQINSVALSGNKSANDLGLEPALDIVTKTLADTSQTLAENIFYIWPTMPALTITCPATGGPYAFRFTSGSTPTTLTMTGITMPDSFAVEADRVYEINVLQGYGVATSWEVSS